MLRAPVLQQLLCIRPLRSSPSAASPTSRGHAQTAQIMRHRQSMDCTPATTRKARSHTTQATGYGKGQKSTLVDRGRDTQRKRVRKLNEGPCDVYDACCAREKPTRGGLLMSKVV